MSASSAAERELGRSQRSSSPNNDKPPALGRSADKGAKAWSKGVYRRDFQNGIALVNPKRLSSRKKYRLELT